MSASRTDIVRSEPYQQGYTSQWLRRLADALYTTAPYLLNGMRLVELQPVPWCTGHNRPDELCEQLAPKRGCVYRTDLVFRVVEDETGVTE